MVRLLCGVLLFFIPLVAQADPLTIATWNLEGPTGLNNKKLKGFAAFVKNADVVVIEEVLGVDQMDEALREAGLDSWRGTVSDFAKDSLKPYQRQELAVITPHQIGKVREIDPYDGDDTTAMKANDEDFEVPSWMPADQRNSKGARGWLWVEIPDLKLVVVAVHLKSSRGEKGKSDEKNSFKREAVASGLASEILKDSKDRTDWSYVVAGDFNVAPGDSYKIGTDLTRRCSADDCRHYDQTHALFGGGLVHGLTMRNLTVGLSASYAKRAFVESPIDNIYAHGPIFDRTTRLVLQRGSHFGSDHYAVRVTVE